MLLLNQFVRRLLVQALVSSIVMAGIQGTLRFGPDLPLSFLDWADSGGGETVAHPPGKPDAPTGVLQPALAFAQDRTHADVKAGRFAVWREREAEVSPMPPERLVSRGASAGLSDVILFDHCRPSCESRDPLLAFNRVPSVLPRSKAPEAIAGSSTVATAVAVEAAADASVGEGVVTSAARSGVSWARRIAGSAGSVVGW